MLSRARTAWLGRAMRGSRKGPPASVAECGCRYSPSSSTITSCGGGGFLYAQRRWSHSQCSSTSSPQEEKPHHTHHNPTVESLLASGQDREAAMRLSKDQLERLLRAHDGWQPQNVPPTATATPSPPQNGEAVATSSTASDETPTIVRPKGKQWVLLFIRTALPFYAFGVCDNIIMISVGDLIDEHFGVVLGFSTLVAAGLGQAVSDGSGVTLQCVIERWTKRIHFADPGVDPRYLDSQSGNRIQQLFRTVGIVVGCLCGLLPVIMTDSGNKPRLYDLMLGALPEEDRRKMSSMARYHIYDKGDYIVRENEEVSHLDTVITGSTEVVRVGPEGDEVQLCTQGPGDGIGYLELVYNHRAVASVRCTSQVKTLRISREDFNDAMRGQEHTFRKSVDAFIRVDPGYAPYRIMKRDASNGVGRELSAPEVAAIALSTHADRVIT